MRVVSGTLKGRRFSPPESFEARPTTDFAKENLFNILCNFVNFDEVKVLDLFGGSGGITYEFASRGCTNITCIEKDPRNQRFIAKTIADFNISNCARCLRADALQYITHTQEKYDIIFADPPYSLPEVDSLPDNIIQKGLLSADGFFVLEHSNTGRFATHPNLWQARTYGKVNFTFFRP